MMTLLRRSPRYAVLALFLYSLTSPRLAPAESRFERIAKAQPDEFFVGIGKGYYPLGSQPPDLSGLPKVNHSYVWGMASDGRYVWFGTAVDTIPYALTGLTDFPLPKVFTSPLKGIPYRVAEYRRSQYPGLTFLEKLIDGDWRPPQVFRLDTQTGSLHEFTPDDPLISSTLGLRSAGINRGVVFLAGPTLSSNGICLFAFDVESGRYLGSQLLTQYNNIRRWTIAQGELYTAVRNAPSFLPSAPRGSVLKWVGDRTSPFRFEVVGQVDNEGAYLTEHEARLVCATWPSFDLLGALLNELPPQAGLWVSPEIPSQGLSSRHAHRWTKVWEAGQYDPDPVIAHTCAMGAMASYGDHLYFGTMMFPGLAALQLRNQYGAALSADDEAKSQRSAMLLRAKNLGATGGPSVELLYGDSEAWVYASRRRRQGSWSRQPTGMGGPGRFGGSGFGDPNNLFLWSAAVHQDRLFFGTMDMGNVTLGFGELVDGVPKPTIGADFFQISSPDSPGVPLSITGCGNQANHGIVNMVSTPAGLYLGTANGMNLLTDPNDDLPDGGWELLRLVDTP
jgi:hypothetical protein